MSQSRATRDLARRRVTAQIYVDLTARNSGRIRGVPRQEMRELVAAGATLGFAPTTARDIYSYRANITSRNAMRGQKRRIERYAGFGSERRLAIYRTAVGEAMLGDDHAVNRQRHVVEAGCQAGDVWAFEVRDRQRRAGSGR